jgi:hypothetical protein
MACSLDLPYYNTGFQEGPRPLQELALSASDGFGLFSQLRDRLNEEDLLLRLMVARNIWLRHNSFVFVSVFNPPQQVMCKETRAEQILHKSVFLLFSISILLSSNESNLTLTLTSLSF